jgi:hypothetical protein
MEQDTLGGGATGTASTPQQPAGIKQELASDAKDIGKAAQERLGAKASEGKEQATQAARSTSTALNKAVEQLRQEDGVPDWLTSGIEKAAREIERFAGNLEGKDMQSLGREVTNFARRSPISFLAAAAIAGFAAARILRAGSDYSQEGGSGGQGTGGQSLGTAGGGQELSSTGIGEGPAGDRSTFTWSNDGAQGGSMERIGQ